MLLSMKSTQSFTLPTPGLLLEGNTSIHDPDGFLVLYFPFSLIFSFFSRKLLISFPLYNILQSLHSLIFQ
ncbi:hypothetical protein EYC84_007943 [Monilinia fructicola]|uniref:Uncharacterized protein n=1 Tax=Monilinia fructicola TaxID=38448 RepID=A0A5M9JI49_MONFR|nr:hypothetical protein EYC84_007943 [Monilinia fructicola]